MPRRNTRQQAAILQAFQQASAPLSPQQVLVEAQKVLSGVSQATVYRVIKGLLEEDAIAAIQLPGQAPLYELAGKTHHHFFRCRQCEKMYEVKGCDDLLTRLLPRGFRLEEHEVFLKGVCSGCRG
jgi:Fur family ferric uptake transcriptional regulator